jgi:hypothetical protein
MKNLFIKNKNRAFILPLTLLITTVILAVATGISSILLKQMFFSRLSRESLAAFYAADSGLACAIYIDDAYVDQATGIGIFEYDPTLGAGVWTQTVFDSVNDLRFSRGIPLITTVDNIKCATTPIFIVASSSISVSDFSSTGGPADGRTTTFDYSMNLGDGTNRCATITINKTENYRQIISQGYNTCNKGSMNLIERAVINTTEIN